MPELPEVEVLVRHLGPLLVGRTVRQVQVRRPKVLGATAVGRFQRALTGAKFAGLSRRGKYLLFSLVPAHASGPTLLLGHLGMTGRMYLAPAREPEPKHTAVMLDLGREHFIYEDTRYFGKLTLEAGALLKLGPEPLAEDFTAEGFRAALQRSTQPIKVKLLDQSVVAGVGNIYASEALFRAGILPTVPAQKLTVAQTIRLWRAIREVLREAIAAGSTVPLNYSGKSGRNRLFYFGSAPDAPNYYAERLRVYDRLGQPCNHCRTPIRRLFQAARSTFYCPQCQTRRGDRIR